MEIEVEIKSFVGGDGTGLSKMSDEELIQYILEIDDFLLIGNGTVST